MITDCGPLITVDRRSFIAGTAATLAATLSGTSAAIAAAPDLKALAFDGFALFNPAPVFKLAQTLFPERGAALGAEWRNRLFQYTWLRASAGQYVDFSTCIEDALVFAARATQVDLDLEAREKLVSAYMSVIAYPDVLPALRRFKGSGLRLVILANPTSTMLARAVERSGLLDIFEDVISTDRIKSYKPDPRTYQLAVDSLGLSPDDIGFVASADWDAAGAAWFGFPSFWVNRSGAPHEQLGVTHAWTGMDMESLAQSLLS